MGGVTVRVAMWSGPRTISTAMMRSFGARPDTLVVDEPLYAYYLAQTGLDHPGRSEVLASQPTRWQDVVAALLRPLPGVAVHYQKHMAHHLLPEVGRDWLAGVSNAYLVRDPAAVVASYARVRRDPTLAELGCAQQVEIFRRYGGPVLDATDILRDPPGCLRALCAALGIPHTDEMTSWPPGRRSTDGVWAPYWYGAVENSTGFAPYDPTPPAVPDHLRALVEEARTYYAELFAHRLHP
jgi:hypothetical protein